jgi:cytoskeletal protein CcmA (bactofilin family)
MAARRTGDDTFINSIVGNGTFFRGHLELSGLLRIDGDFSGSLLTDGRVIVGQHGRADCAIEAATVVIGGIFKGEMLAYEKVVLLSSSIVIGSITTPRLVAEEGVVFSGRLQVKGKESERAPGPASEKRKELLIESIRQRETSKAVVSQPRKSFSDKKPQPAHEPVAPGEKATWSG